MEGVVLFDFELACLLVLHGNWAEIVAELDGTGVWYVQSPREETATLRKVGYRSDKNKRNVLCCIEFDLCCWRNVIEKHLCPIHMRKFMQNTTLGRGMIIKATSRKFSCQNQSKLVAQNTCRKAQGHYSCKQRYRIPRRRT